MVAPIQKAGVSKTNLVTKGYLQGAYSWTQRQGLIFQKTKTCYRVYEVLQGHIQVNNVEL